MASRTAPDNGPLRRQTLAGSIYQRLLADISSGALPPGHRLVINKLAEELKVSITPVREALMRLQSEGLITEEPYHGLRVAELAIDKLRELFETRGVLEGYAARVALGRMQERDIEIIEHELHCLQRATEMGDAVEFRRHNPRFHGAILAPSKDHAIHAEIAQLVSRTERYLAVGVALLDRQYLESSQAEHHRMMDLVRLRSADALEILIRNHALTFVTHMERRMRT